MLKMLKMMIVIDNDDGNDDVDNIDKDWIADGGSNENDDFDVDAGYVIVDVGVEDFDAHNANDSDDYDGD